MIRGIISLAAVVVVLCLGYVSRLIDAESPTSDPAVFLTVMGGIGFGFLIFAAGVAVGRAERAHSTRASTSKQEES